MDGFYLYPSEQGYTQDCLSDRISIGSLNARFVVTTLLRRYSLLQVRKCSLCAVGQVQFAQDVANVRNNPGHGNLKFVCNLLIGKTASFVINLIHHSETVYK